MDTDSLNLALRSSGGRQESLSRKTMFLMWYNERFKDEMHYMHPKYTQLADMYFRDIEEEIMKWDVTNRDIRELR